MKKPNWIHSRLHVLRMHLAEVPKLKVAVPLLVICLAASLFLNIYPLLNNNGKISENENSESETFVFFEMNQYPFADGVGFRKLILNSTDLTRVQVTFDWSKENLTIAIGINDDEYSYADYVGLAFDIDGDQRYECIFPLLACNRTVPAEDYPELTSYGGIKSFGLTMPLPSPWHYCTFEPGSGYLFHFSVSKETIQFSLPLRVHLCFGDWDAMGSSMKATGTYEAATAYWEFQVG